MYQYIKKLVIYRNDESMEILNEMGHIFRAFSTEEYDGGELEGRILDQINRLLELATDYGFDGNLWCNYIAYILAVSENPFTISCEKQGALEGTVNTLVKKDLEQFREILHYDFSVIEKKLDMDYFRLITNYQSVVKPERRFNKSVSDRIQELSEQLLTCETSEDLYQTMVSFYLLHGVGMLGLNKAFRIDPKAKEVQLAPITNISRVEMDDIIGYDIQKSQLQENTEAFLAGKRANNVLLCGDSGTGKSTSIKALLNRYYSKGLRIIEIYKHQFKDLSRVLEMIKDRNYRFIIFMDDLVQQRKPNGCLKCIFLAFSLPTTEGILPSRKFT